MEKTKVFIGNTIKLVVIGVICAALLIFRFGLDEYEKRYGSAGNLDAGAFFSAIVDGTLKGDWSAIEESLTDDDRYKIAINHAYKNAKGLVSYSATPAQEFSYEIINNKYIKITQYQGVREQVEIPAMIENKPVCLIGENAFAENIYLKSVKLPDTVVEICAGAFRNCKSLTHVELSCNLNTIGEVAFFECVKLKEIGLEEDSALHAIGNSAFEACSSLEKVYFHNSIYDDVHLGSAVFKNCTALKSVELPDNLLEVGAYAFEECDALTSITLKDAKVVGQGAFLSCDGLKKLILSKNVERIDNQCFLECVALQTIVIGEKINYIGEGAFMNCTSLEVVTIEERYLTADEEGAAIGADAFHNTKLKELVVPSQFLYVGDRAVAECKSLKTFKWHNSRRNVSQQCLANHVFDGCKSSLTIYLPQTVSEIGDWDLENMGKLVVYAADGSYARQVAKEREVKSMDWDQ